MAFEIRVSEVASGKRNRNLFHAEAAFTPAGGGGCELHMCPNPNPTRWAASYNTSQRQHPSIDLQGTRPTLLGLRPLTRDTLQNVPAKTAMRCKPRITWFAGNATQNVYVQCEQGC